MGWETLRNPNTPIAPSINDEYMVVPVPTDPRIKGYAVVKITDLKPEFKTLKDAQRWADAQAGRGGTSRPSTNPPREGNAK
jgi:hypothetical protein